jgi:hypothetical protein
VVVTRPVAMSYTWPETLTFGESRGEVSRRSNVGLDGGVWVGDRRGFQRRLGQAGCLGGLAPEAGVGQEAGAALGVVDDSDLEETVRKDLSAEQLPGEVGEVGDVVDDGRVTRPPALRMTTASPSWSPGMIAGSTRWSRQLTMSTCAVGGPSGAGV